MLQQKNRGLLQISSFPLSGNKPRMAQIGVTRTAQVSLGMHDEKIRYLVLGFLFKDFGFQFRDYEIFIPCTLLQLLPVHI